ncbi:MAG TPA: hypothetical protein QGF58_02590 [Myxococcota bacterium]|nr:hypothetical protein [Myxococcota bacterium]
MILLLACSGNPEPQKVEEKPALEVLAEAPDKASTKVDFHLEAAVLTSEGLADGLLRGNDAWVPIGNPNGEGLLLRFAEPFYFSKLEVSACSTGPAWTPTVFVNGARVDDRRLEPGGTKAVQVGEVVKSVFVRMSHAEPGACMGGVRFLDSKGEDLNVLPPRHVGAEVRASSTLEPADAYHTLYLVDSRTDFGWVEGAKGTGAGESLSITLDEEVELHGVRLWNGYQRSEDHFKKNARLKKVTLSFDTGSVTLEVPDAMGPSELSFDPVKTRSLKLTIDEVTPGSRYEDLVISELELIDEDGPLSLRTWDDRAKALRTAHAGTALGALMDQQLESVCSDEWITQAKLRSNHSFVVYGESMDTSTVFDGAWVPLGKEGAWTAVKLYGRRHRIRSTYQPYGTDTTDEETRIGGGKLLLARASDLDEETWIVTSAELAWGLTCSPNLSHAEAIEMGIVLMKGADIDAVVAF